MDADNIFHAIFHIPRHKKEYAVGSAFLAGALLQHAFYKLKHNKN